MTALTFKVIVLSVLLALTGTEVSAKGSAELRDGLSNYSVLSWTDADGRSLGNVYAIAQTPDGYLWIGADAGLFRFDGARFAQWETLSATALPKASVTALSVSTDGTLWVGFADSFGVRKLKGTNSLAIRDDGRGLGAVNALAEDREGSLWAAIDRSLYVLGPQRWEQVSVHDSRSFGQSSGIVSVRLGATGELWVGSTEGAYRRDGRSRTFQRIPRPKSPIEANGDWVWDVSQGVGGTLWTTDMATGFSRRSSKGDWSHPASPVMGYRLLPDRHGNVWVATIGEGLWRVAAAEEPSDSWQIERITLSSGLTSDSVRSIFEDRDGHLWVGTTVGLHKLTRRTLRPVNRVGLAVSVDAVSDGRVLIGTSNSLIVLPDGARDIDRRQVVGSNLWVTQALQDPTGRIWVSALEGFYQLKGGRLVRVAGLGSDRPRIGSFAFDGSGTGWLVSPDGTFFLRQGELRRFDSQAEWGVARVSHVFADHTGALWVMSSEGRVGVRSIDGRFRMLGEADGLQGRGRVQTIYEDREGTVWLGTDAGFGAFIDKRFVALDRGIGVLAGHIGAVVEDDQGYLWLNSEPGLLRVKRAELATALTDPAYRPHYTVYDSSDGLAGASIVRMRATRDASGLLWFIRGGGLTVIDPKTLGGQPDVHARAIRIDAALADVRKLEPVDGIELPRDVKTLQINYAALELNTANKLQFRYRLEGFDNDWVEVGSRRQAIYTNLPPGAYRFQVQARANGESWSDTAAWGFELPPKFYQSPWFYLLGLAILAALSWTTWRIRLRVVQHEFALVLAERNRVSREIHDTLLQCMVGLTLQLNKLSRLVLTSPPQAAAMASRMREQVEMYIRDARLTIFDLRSPALTTQDLFTALDEFGHRATSDYGIVFQSRCVGAARRLPANVETQILRVGQEAITNVVRHANARHLALDLCFDDDTLTLRVRDDGRGFDANAYANLPNVHYGLAQMRERAAEVGGQFSISAPPGGGTLVEVVVPVERAPSLPADLHVA